MDRSSLLARIRKDARKNGVFLVGNEQSGHFSHAMLKGEYSMAGEKVIVTIREKPLWLPWSLVEAKLRELVS